MPPTQITLDTPKVTLGWDEELRCVVIAWKGITVTRDDYRAILMQSLDLLEMKHGSRLLADTRNTPVVASDNLAWIRAEWEPRSVRVGLRHTAGVVPKGGLTKPELLPTTTEGPHDCRQRTIFGTLEEAKAWLRSLPP